MATIIPVTPGRVFYRDSIISKGPTFYVVRNGARGFAHVAVHLGGDRFLTACNNRRTPANVDVYGKGKAHEVWDDDKTRRCDKCNRKVNAL